MEFLTHSLIQPKNYARIQIERDELLRRGSKQDFLHLGDEKVLYDLYRFPNVKRSCLLIYLEKTELSKTLMGISWTTLAIHQHFLSHFILDENSNLRRCTWRENSFRETL